MFNVETDTLFLQGYYQQHFRYVDAAGQQRVQGGGDLKSSQHYPKLFGSSVAQLVMSQHDFIKETMAKQQRLGPKAGNLQS